MSVVLGAIALVGVIQLIRFLCLVAMERSR